MERVNQYIKPYLSPILTDVGNHMTGEGRDEAETIEEGRKEEEREERGGEKRRRRRRKGL